MKQEEKYFAIDFDGTCTTHEYPAIGQDIGAVPVLKRLLLHGHKLILFTMRSGKELDDAVKWFEDNDLELFGINRNPTQTWTESPKAYAHCYIDDASLFIPLKVNIDEGNSLTRPYVDWVKVEKKLIEIGYITL